MHAGIAYPEGCGEGEGPRRRARHPAVTAAGEAVHQLPHDMLLVVHRGELAELHTAAGAAEHGAHLAVACRDEEAGGAPLAALELGDEAVQQAALGAALEVVQIVEHQQHVLVCDVLGQLPRKCPGVLLAVYALHVHAYIRVVSASAAAPVTPHSGGMLRKDENLLETPGTSRSTQWRATAYLVVGMHTA